MVPPATMRFASAVSDEEPLSEALEDVTGAVSESLEGGAVDLALVFATSHHRNHVPLIAERVNRQLRPRVLLGITAGGVLATGAEIEQRAGLSLLAARMDGVWLRPFTYDDLNWPGDGDDPAALRRSLLGAEHETDTPAALLIFADPYSTPMVKLIPAINAALPGVPVIGGLASGSSNAGETRLLLNDRVTMSGAVGVAIGGAVRVDCTVSQGCRPIGPPYVITKAQHNIIQEVGRRPVIEVLQTMASELTEEEQGLLRGGLLVGRVISEYRDHFGRGDFLIRTIVGADQENGCIAIADLVRVGQTIQFHVRDARTAEEDLRLLMETQSLHGPAAGALLCTCNGRGVRLFGSLNLETSIIRGAIGEVPMAGFFAAGEIGPIGRENFVHGFTSSLAVFRPVG
jgi:small ligand-binding sensory domain FIST